MATKDFTKQREAISFTIAPDEFRAYPAMAADTLINYAARLQNLASGTVEDQYAVYKTVLQELLYPDSFARFVERMGDKENPIDLEQLDDVTTWLFSEYGLRPTQPSGPSPTGPSSPAPGNGSTESTPVEVSISEPSLSIAS